MGLCVGDNEGEAAAILLAGSETTTVRKYYFAGSSRIAMREDGTLYWLISDHLGSTSMTATANGEIFSEVRFSTNATPMDYLYTGQRMTRCGL